MRGGIWSEIFDRYKEQFVESIRMSPQLKKRIQTLEYDFKNLKQQAQNTCTDKECFKKIKEDFPYFNYFDETISVAFLYLLFWHCSRRLLLINGKSCFAIVLKNSCPLNTCTAAFSHLIKLREKD